MGAPKKSNVTIQVRVHKKIAQRFNSSTNKPHKYIEDSLIELYKLSLAETKAMEKKEIYEEEFKIIQERQEELIILMKVQENKIKERKK